MKTRRAAHLGQEGPCFFEKVDGEKGNGNELKLLLSLGTIYFSGMDFPVVVVQCRKGMVLTIPTILNIINIIIIIFALRKKNQNQRKKLLE